MSRISNLTGSGIAPAAALNIIGTAVDSLVATGSTQATALLLSADSNAVITTAASTGVVFPVGTSPGDEIFVKNHGANALSVYPAAGDSIDAIAANGAYSLATTKSAMFVKTSATRWSSLLSA